MGSPSATLASLRPDLATMMEFDLEADRRGFIARRVAPAINVAKQSGSFGKIPIEQLLQTRDTKRNNGSGYARGNFTFTHATYSCEEHGAEEPVDDREKAQYVEYGMGDEIAMQRARDVVLRNAEIRMAALIFNATTWTGASLTTAVGTAWSRANAATATPVADVEAAVQKIWDGSGMWPNALVMDYHVFRNLRFNAELLDRITSSGAGDPKKLRDITVAQLAQVFDLPYIIVAGSGKNSATEGQTVSMASVWGTGYVMVCRVAETQDPREPCIARTFHWTEDGSMIDGMVEEYRDETIRGNVIRVRHDVDEIVMHTESGHLLSNIS